MRGLYQQPGAYLMSTMAYNPAGSLGSCSDRYGTALTYGYDAVERSSG